MPGIIDGLFNANVFKLNKDWKQLKALIKTCIDNGDKPEAFRLLKALAYIGYRYNFLPSFIDDEADDLVLQLTHKIVDTVRPVPVTKERIVFYDYFLLENRGFTQQYIEQVIKNDYELLFITLADEADYSEENAIIKTLRGYSKATIYVVPYRESKARQVQLMLEQIVNYCPSKVFVHNIPYDILPVCVGQALKGTGVSTYFLNISDHAFFLGKNAFDYFIDFRIYGHQLNAVLRNIDPSRLLVIPTPPYLPEQTKAKFDGFPVNTQGKVVGFSGGMTYKIIDRSNTFLNLIKQILDDNPNFIFLFANVFGDTLLKKFIKKNKLEGRFVLIGNRRDINEVYKNIDIYFNTYPFSGGLMMQYAIGNNKPIVSLNDPELVYVRMDKLFDKPWHDKFIINDKEKYVRTARELINSAEYRQNYAKEFAEGIDITGQFETRFAALLDDRFKQETIDMRTFEINTDAVAAFHINMDNLFFKEYKYLKAAFFNKQLKLKGITLPVFLLKVAGKLTGQKYGPTILRY